jgi:hypothetical protein
MDQSARIAVGDESYQIAIDWYVSFQNVNKLTKDI